MNKELSAHIVMKKPEVSVSEVISAHDDVSIAEPKASDQLQLEVKQLLVELQGKATEEEFVNFYHAAKYILDISNKYLN